jgi:hypothetical protein
MWKGGWVGVTARGAWYWRNSADTRWWRIIPWATQSACRISLLHSAAATSWHATFCIRKISTDTQMLVEWVWRVRSKFTTEGWWYQHDVVTETDGHGADSVYVRRCRWTSWLGMAISVGINQADDSKTYHMTTRSDSFPITLASFLNSGRWTILQPT